MRPKQLNPALILFACLLGMLLLIIASGFVNHARGDYYGQSGDDQSGQQEEDQGNSAESPIVVNGEINFFPNVPAWEWTTEGPLIVSFATVDIANISSAACVVKVQFSMSNGWSADVYESGHYMMAGVPAYVQEPMSTVGMHDLTHSGQGQYNVTVTVWYEEMGEWIEVARVEELIYVDW